MEEQDIYQNVDQENDFSQEVVQDSYETENTPEEEYDIIKYNKEEVRIPASERQTYLQKGYNYDKVQKQLEDARKQAEYVSRIAKRQGYENPEEFISAFEEMENQRRIEEEAQKIGVDTEVFKEYLEPMRSELELLREERKKLQSVEMERQIDAEIQLLSQKYPDFEQVQMKVFDIAVEKGYELEDAYILATFQDKLNQAEQNTLAKIASRDERQVLSSIDKPGEQLFDPGNLTSSQIKEISRRVQNGERITF
jgi:hypothetical protein